MKGIFNNKRILVFSILFAFFMLSLLVLLLSQWLLHLDIPSFVFGIALLGILGSGSYLVVLRGEPPW